MLISSFVFYLVHSISRMGPVFVPVEGTSSK